MHLLPLLAPGPELAGPSHQVFCLTCKSDYSLYHFHSLCHSRFQSYRNAFHSPPLPCPTRLWHVILLPLPIHMVPDPPFPSLPNYLHPPGPSQTVLLLDGLPALHSGPTPFILPLLTGYYNNLSSCLPSHKTVSSMLVHLSVRGLAN